MTKNSTDQADHGLFDRNIERFGAFQPKVAYLLPYHDASDVVRCQTSVGEDNLQKQATNSSYYLHSPSGARKEAQEWFSRLRLDAVEVLYVIGVGLGYAYEAAKAWLHRNPKHHLVFLEEDLSVLFHFFGTHSAEKLLKDPQVTLRYSRNLMADKELSDWLCWDFVARPIAVTALPAYQRHHGELVAELENKLAFDHHRLNEAIDEYLDHGVSYFRNFYPNVLRLHESYVGEALFGHFQGCPAIICGAGPSLQKALPWLAQVRNRALIFAGGSAINALNASGIQPHFGVGIDPNSSQYQRFLMQSAYETPFFFRLRLHEAACRSLHGPRVYLSGSGGYDTAAWFESVLDLEGSDLDEGHNVVNLCASIARALGCNPIVFVGLDLAYTGMKAYAPGIVHQVNVEEHRLLTNTGVDKAAVLREDIYGQPIYTLWKWIAEAEWLSNFAKEHPEITLLNATEGGLGIPAVAHLAPHKVAEEFLTEERDLEGIIWAAMQEAQLPLDAKQRVEEAWNQLDASLASCIDKLETMLSELHSLWNAVSASSDEQIELKTGLMAITELELEEEAGYQFVLNIFNEVYIRTLNREVRQLKTSDATWQQKQLKQLELETRRYAFLKETARINREIMRESLQEVSS